MLLLLLATSYSALLVASTARTAASHLGRAQCMHSMADGNALRTPHVSVPEQCGPSTFRGEEARKWWNACIEPISKHVRKMPKLRQYRYNHALQSLVYDMPLRQKSML